MLRRSLGFVLAICALALTASCVSPEELRRQHEAVCTGYGFKPRTNDFANCLQRENLARRYAIPTRATATVLGELGILGPLVGAILALDGMDACIGARLEQPYPTSATLLQRHRRAGVGFRRWAIKGVI